MIKNIKLLSKILLLLVLISCSDNKESKTIQLDDIRPKSNQINSSKNQESEDSSKIKLKDYIGDSINLNFKYLKEINETRFIKRFPHVKSGSRILYPLDTTIQFLHEFYTYKDSITMKNAFFNWLDCNGKNCESIKLYEERKIEPTNLLILCTSKSIDIIRGNQNLNTLEWINFVRFSRKNEDFKYILFQKKNQKSKWFEFANHQLIQRNKK
jgi:hypothetical protein